MSGAYRLIEVLKRLHPRFLFEESHGQLVDAFWASQDLGEPDLDPFTGEGCEMRARIWERPSGGRGCKERRQCRVADCLCE